MTTQEQTIAEVVGHPPFPLWPEGGQPDGITDGPVPCLTPYLPAGVTLQGAVIVCPGGGYGNRAPHEREPIARWLAGLGMAAFVLDYRVAPHHHPAPLNDVQRAIRLVRHHAAEWGLADPRIAVLGFSAGGHLAATAGVYGDDGDPASADPVARASSRPDALVLCYAVISLVEFWHQRSTENLLGPDPSVELRTAMSLETRVTAETPPTFLWHTVDDASVPVEHSLLFAAALRRQGVPFALHIYPHGRHGLGLTQDDPLVGTWTDLCARWLATQGFGTPPAP
jgi:acetyl esterase/lipase